MLFKTKIALGDETRLAQISYETVLGDVLITKILIALDVNESYSFLGVTDPSPTRRWLDVTPVISDRQTLRLIEQIRAANQVAPYRKAA